MNKFFLILVINVVSVCTLRAQTLSAKILRANNWERMDNNKTYTVQCNFDLKKMYTHIHYKLYHPIKKCEIDTTINVAYNYYLTNVFPQEFSPNEVGVASSGKYLVLHNITARIVEPGECLVYEVSKLSDSEIEFNILYAPNKRVGKKIFRKK
jgi:hypothetical protein